MRTNFKLIYVTEWFSSPKVLITTHLHFWILFLLWRLFYEWVFPLWWKAALRIDVFIVRAKLLDFRIRVRLQTVGSLFENTSLVELDLSDAFILFWQVWIGFQTFIKQSRCWMPIRLPLLSYIIPIKLGLTGIWLWLSHLREFLLMLIDVCMKLATFNLLLKVLLSGL
jgi:hypothetical protein